jgi:phosphate transport system permease protein
MASAGSRAWGERAVAGVLLTATLLSASVVVLVFAFVVKNALPVITYNGLGLITKGGWDNQLRVSAHSPSWTFGLLELIAGTALTTLGALTLTLIIGMGSAVALVEYAPKRVSRPIESIVRLLAGFPSVVFGLVGIAVIAPWIGDTLINQQMQDQYLFISTGQCLLAAILVLTFMIMPFFVSVAIDSLRAVPESYRLGGAALGMPTWRVATRLVIPSASPGILAGLVLAAARGVGEAIAMAMVGGANAHIPFVSSGVFAVLEPVRTLAAAIVENGESASNPYILSAMYACATIILLTSIALSIFGRVMMVGFQKRMRLMSGRSG